MFHNTQREREWAHNHVFYGTPSKYRMFYIVQCTENTRFSEICTFSTTMAADEIIESLTIPRPRIMPFDTRDTSISFAGKCKYDFSISRKCPFVADVIFHAVHKVWHTSVRQKNWQQVTCVYALKLKFGPLKYLCRKCQRQTCESRD